MNDALEDLYDLNVYPELAMPVTAVDHAIGPATAPVTLVEYGDYECPYTRAAYLSINELIESYGNTLRFVYRHFPISFLHSHAETAAEASEAAGAEGKFWEMHSVLLMNQDSLDPESLISYARVLKLDLDAFIYALGSGMYESRIGRDVRSGMESGVRGTPTFFINGRRYSGSYDAQTLYTAIKLALKNA